MPRFVEAWGNRSKLPQMRIEARLVVLDREGTPLREFERFHADYCNGDLCVRDFHSMRGRFARYKRQGRLALAESDPEV